MKRIGSFSFNPISACLLIGYYKYDIPKTNSNLLFLKYKSNLEKEGVNIKTILFNSYKHNVYPNEIYVPINDDNIAKAHNIFNDLISKDDVNDSILCMDETQICNK